MSNSVVLAVDAGNTRTKFGVFELLSHGGPRPIALTAILNTATDSALRQLAEWLQSLKLDKSPVAAVIAGSQPETRDTLAGQWPFSQFPVRVVSDFSQIPVELDVDAPERVGTDRLLNAFAVADRLSPGTACIVVDSGTATTIDLVTHGPVFHGGAILPGVRLSAHAMHDYTARLPLLPVEQSWEKKPVVPARNTKDAMLAGLLWGHLGAVREILNRTSEAATRMLGVVAEEQLVLTGGGGRFLQQHLPNAICIDSLALHGLARLHRS
jgi:type III pantothenate kinase